MLKSIRIARTTCLIVAHTIGVLNDDEFFLGLGEIEADMPPVDCVVAIYPVVYPVFEDDEDDEDDWDE